MLYPRLKGHTALVFLASPHNLPGVAPYFFLSQNGHRSGLTHWMIGLGPNWMIVTMNGLGPKSLLRVDIPVTTT